jgi:hypothetical protein
MSVPQCFWWEGKNCSNVQTLALIFSAKKIGTTTYAFVKYTQIIQKVIQRRVILKRERR